MQVRKNKKSTAQVHRSYILFSVVSIELKIIGYENGHFVAWKYSTKNKKEFGANRGILTCTIGSRCQNRDWVWGMSMFHYRLSCCKFIWSACFFLLSLHFITFNLALTSICTWYVIIFTVWWRKSVQYVFKKVLYYSFFMINTGSIIMHVI